MSSFSCLHFDQKNFYLLLNKNCLPGMKGCVLKNKVQFAIPVEERMKKQPLDPFKEFRQKKK
jgi:hypothetical protein